ncbi:hypothetical protein QJQ45_011265 [Haematococcus lacustris]|nr:hypothetical protein QJQ45_011265 [Haematococcus lacustris]
MLRLASRRQAMGTWVLWDPRLLLTPADLDCILSTAPKPPATSPTWPAAPNTLPTAAAKAAPSSPSATTAAKPSSSSPSTAAAEPSTAAAAAAGMGTQAGIPVHAAAGAVSGPHLGKDVPAGCLAAAGLRVAAWVGLRPGALLQGTCVTNFQTLDISTHQRLGSAMLGHVQVRVLAVTASPQASPGSLFAPHNPLAEATLQLDLAARCHSISPFSPDVVHTAAEDDSAYTPAATLTARVVLMPDGTLHPAPAAADSGRPTSTGTEHLTTRPMLHARAPAHLALTLSERLQAEGRVVPQPQLVDQWPVDMHGLASGGVLCGMLLHPVIGRATFFVVWSAATVQSSELRAAHFASVHASAGPRTPPAKQREERRAEWKTQRRQVIKVPGGAVLRGCKKTKRKLLAHFQLRAGIHSQLRVIASLYVLRIFLTCLVGYSTPGYPSAPTPPAVQPPRALDAAPLPPLPMRVPAQPASMDMDWEPEPDPDPEPEPEPEPAPAPPTLRPPSARLAARHPPPAAPTGPPMPLDSEDPVLLQQLKVFCLYFANTTFLTPYNQLQRRLGRARQNKHFSIKPAFDDPSNQELLAKLQQLGSANFTAAGPSSSNSSPAAAPGAAAVSAHELGLPRIGKGLAEQRDFVFNPDTQIGVGIDPGVTQAVSAASGVWDPMTGQLQADQLRRWKLTKGEVKHGSGLNNARRNTERWLAPIKPHLQHLAAASPAGTSLEANLKHITVTLATWDVVWEVYLDPKWAEQRLRLYGAQDRTLEQFFKKLEEGMAEVSMERHGHAKQLVVFFGAATIGTGGGWGADAVLRACRKVVCRTRGTDQRRGMVVLVDEHRTSRVSSAVNGQQPCERQLNKRRATRPAGWKPPAGQVEPRLVRPAWSQQRDQPVRGMMWCPVVPPRKPPQAPRSSQAATQPAAASEPGPSTPLPAKRTKAEPETAEPTKGKGKAAKAKPAPQPGRWLDRDCNAALNMQRIGESRWRPLELCYWSGQGKLPAKGKEYPGLGYKRLRDKAPKAQQQQAPPI